MIGNESFDDLVLYDVDAPVVDDGNVVIVGPDGDIFHVRLFSTDQASDPGCGASFESLVEAFIQLSERRQTQDIKIVFVERFGDVLSQAALLLPPEIAIYLFQMHYHVVKANGEFLCVFWELIKLGLFSAN